MKVLLRHILALAATALMATACSNDDASERNAEGPVPEGYGQIALTIATPEVAGTRGATGSWIEGTGEERAIRSYHLLICDGNTIEQVISGTGRMPDKNDVGTYGIYSSSDDSPLLQLNGTTTGNVSFYVNETDASATSMQNQYSVRFKIQRYNSVTDTWYGNEFRLGFTSPHTGGGFSVIRRNDWIKIPIMLTDWEFRVEMLPYAPIAGYAAYVESADALETVFNTQGYICMRPLFRNSATDAPGVWHTITDGGITLDLPHAQGDYDGGQCINTTSDTGIILTGDLGIFTDKFVQLGSTENIVANLSSSKGTATVTLRVKLGGYTYEFSHNVTRK